VGVDRRSFAFASTCPRVFCMHSRVGCSLQALNKLICLALKSPKHQIDFTFFRGPTAFFYLYIGMRRQVRNTHTIRRVCVPKCVNEIKYFPKRSTDKVEWRVIQYSSLVKCTHQSTLIRACNYYKSFDVSSFSSLQESWEPATRLGK